MKKKCWKLLVVGLLTIPLGIGSVTSVAQAENAIEQSTQAIQTENSQTTESSQIETQQTEPSQTEEPEQAVSPDVTNLAPAKRAVPEQENIAPDPKTAEVENENAQSASLPVEVYAANSLKPIYRVYNPNSGEHLHTLNGGEKDNLMSLGWVYEGISMQIN